jgi:hypothetical protein
VIITAGRPGGQPRWSEPVDEILGTHKVDGLGFSEIIVVRAVLR